MLYVDPPPVITPPENVRLTAGYNHACVVTDSGGVKCWGQNEYGQLGDDTTTTRRTPVDVIGLDSGITSIVAGHSHTCAVTTEGAVKCWGDNFKGELGDGTQTHRSTPVGVLGLDSGVTALAAGYNHTCALTISGGVKCWGFNFKGQLGNGTQADSLTPVDVDGLDSGVAAIAAANSHTCALTDAGGVKCWGQNDHGRLGDGTTTDRPTPVDVRGLVSGAISLTAGYSHTCATLQNGDVKCWGWNGYGQLGDGTQIERSTPVDVRDLTGGGAIAAGNTSTCAVSSNGGVKCWGSNGYGQLGDSTRVVRYTPVNVSGLDSGFVAVATGNDHACALTSGGGVRCWGRNNYGQLGDGTLHDRLTPADVQGIDEGGSYISVLYTHSCALNSNGGAKCWGENNFGQLGDGTTIDRFSPAFVSGLESGVIAVEAGSVHSCALTTNGGVKCWGLNTSGALGDGTTNNRLTPVDVIGLEHSVAAIATGTAHTCALTNNGGVKCWGDNAAGQLGDGTTTAREIPVDVSGLDQGVVAIASGSFHTCALTASGGVKCWGTNFFGNLGDGTQIDRHTPVDVQGLDSVVTALTASYGLTCALTHNGGVKCWGKNTYGQLGDGTQIDRSLPVDVIGLEHGATAIGTGLEHACAVTTEGGVKCWGENSYGKLGDGSNTDRLIPIDVFGLTSGFVAVDGGEEHTCAVAADGGVKCWGQNTYGQLGVNPGWAPVTVVGLEGSE
ncbi:MAG: hypothetical protein R2873_21940 [Caldilineaceae bacterium]